MSGEEEAKCSILSAIRDLSCDQWDLFFKSRICLHCIFRLLGCSHPACYRESEEQWLESVDRKISDGTCGLCLDIFRIFFRMLKKYEFDKAPPDEKSFELKTLPATLFKTLTELSTTGFQFDSFTLHLRLPSSLTVYQEAFIRANRAEISALVTEKVTEIKVALRKTIAAVLEVIFQSSYNADGDFSVSFEFSSPDADEYVRRTFEVPKPKAPKKYERGNKFSKRAKSGPTIFLTNKSVADIIRSDPQSMDQMFLSISDSLLASDEINILDNFRDTSIEEIISGSIQSFSGCKSIKFTSSGREDMDVRMLGSGRPFALELLNSKCSMSALAQQLNQLEVDINRSSDAVKVIDLRISSADEYSSLQKNTEEKKKTYRCLVWCEEEITQDVVDLLEPMKDVEINQKTPIRVLHRRAQLTRTKTIQRMNSKLIDAHFFEVEIEASAGTYIKEFVHGDLGRTVPNIGSMLGKKVDILELDVIAIESAV